MLLELYKTVHKCNGNMSRTQVQFLLLSVFIAVASCVSFEGEQLNMKLSENYVWTPVLVKNEDNKPTQKNFSYIVRSKTKRACTLASMDISIAVPTGVKNDKIVLNVPNDAEVEGTCSRVISDMKLIWKEKGEDTKENYIRFTFIHDHVSFSIFSIDVNISNFPDTKDKDREFKATSDIDLRLFAANATNEIHKCNRETKRIIGGAEITIKNVSLIAFNTDEDTSKRKDKQCDETDKDTTPKTFPYVLKNEKGNICGLARMSISLKVPYRTKDSKDEQVTIKVPTDLTVSGKCNSQVSRMNLNWKERSQDSTFATNEKENVISFGLFKTDAYTFIHRIDIDIFLDDTNFPNAEHKRLKVSSSQDDSLFFASGENGLYSCANETTLTFDNVGITMSNVLLVAFDVGTDFASKKVTECPGALSARDFSYVVEDSETQIPCTLANMLITINVPCKKGDKDTTVSLIVPKEKVNVIGTCDKKRPTMELSWPASAEKGAKDTQNTLKFYIGRNQSDFFVYQIDAIIYLDDKNVQCPTNEEKALNVTTYAGIALFPGHATNGLYNCTNQAQEIQADNIRLSITDVIFIAFNSEDDLTTRKVSTCSNKPDTDTTTSPTETTESTEPTKPTEPIEPTEPTESTESTESTTELTTTPEPDPSVKEYNYVVTNPETHVACIVANMSISIKIPYQAKNSETKETILRVPTTAKTSGKCESASSTMELSWSEENSREENKLTVTFKRTDSRSFLSSMKLHIYKDAKHFPDAVDKEYNASTKDVDIFSASLKSLYKCEPETSVKADVVGITISKVALISFNTEKDVSSKSVEDCVADVSTDVGAIVGGIIGGLMLIGIMVFLILMYRKKRRFF